MSREIAASIHRRGIVVERDPKTYRVRVRWPDKGSVSAWLDVLTAKSRKDQAQWLPDIGELVYCLMDDRHEDGVVLGALYNDEDGPRSSNCDEARMRFADGGELVYDRAASQMTLTVPAAGQIEIRLGGSRLTITDGHVVIEAGSVDLGGTGGARVARIGDKVNVASGSSAGLWPIVEGSEKVSAV